MNALSRKTVIFAFIMNGISFALMYDLSLKGEYKD